jgi:hypothetical protein
VSQYNKKLRSNHYQKDSRMPPENKRIIIDFGNGQAAFAIRVMGGITPDQVAERLGFHEPSSALFVSGGALAMGSDEMNLTRPMIEDGLVRFAEENKIVIVDGGTRAGVMQLTGECRQRQRLNFPLIGVAPLLKIKYPGYNNPDGQELDNGHSHFVFTEGDSFGAESQMIALLTWSIAGKGKRPALCMVINGGDVTRQEVHRLATFHKLDLPIFVMEGSGRYADNLAAVLRGKRTEDPLLRETADAGNIQLVSVKDGPEALRAKLAEVFAARNV